MVDVSVARVRHIPSGVRAVLKSPGVVDVLQRQAERVANAADGMERLHSGEPLAAVSEHGRAYSASVTQGYYTALGHVMAYRGGRQRGTGEVGKAIVLAATKHHTLQKALRSCM